MGRVLSVVWSQVAVALQSMDGGTNKSPPTHMAVDYGR